jgi:hypothetical protein
MAAQNGNTQIAREYRTKYPDYPTKKLARIMYAENNLTFTNEESARNSLISQGFKLYSPEYAYAGREMLYFQKPIQ